MIKQILIIILLFVLPKNVAYAEDIHLENYHSTSENSAVDQIIFEDSNIYIVLNKDGENVLGTVLYFINFTEESIGMPNPNTSAEDIKEKQIELGIDYQTINQSLTLPEDPNVFTVIGQLEDFSSGIYTKVTPEGKLAFKITQAEIQDQGEIIYVNLYGKRLLTFEKVEDDAINYEGVEFRKN